MDDESKRKLVIFLEQFDTALQPERIRESKTMNQFAGAVADICVLGETAIEIIKLMRAAIIEPCDRINLERYIKQKIKG